MWGVVVLVDILDWAIDLFPRFWSFVGSLIITDGVSVLSIVVVFLLITFLIYAFIPRP